MWAIKGICVGYPNHPKYSMFAWLVTNINESKRLVKIELWGESHWIPEDEICGCLELPGRLRNKE